tara:strand:+ start:190 stop:852 length:663 start_codon:yes stop_codon:yes gene_type:complete
MLILTSALGIVIAAGLSSLIGLEREIHGQPAGLRTHMILGVGASLAAILSISYSQFLSNPDMMSDPGRIVAQVVSGVGFLGAGAILRFGVTVKGLTTASSLWTTAIIGIAAGSGYFSLAAFTTLVVLIILVIIDKIESKFLPSFQTHTLKVTLEDRPGIVNNIKSILKEKGVKMVSLNASMPDKETLKLTMVIRKPGNLGMDSIINLVNSMDAAKSMEID